MPSQASANKQKYQAASSNQTPVSTDRALEPSIATPLDTIEIQEVQGVEDSNSELSLKKAPPAQIDGSVACFTLGRPALCTGTGQDINERQEAGTTVKSPAGSPLPLDRVPICQPKTALPLPQRCAVRAVTGNVLHITKSGKENANSSATQSTFATRLRPEAIGSTCFNCRPWTGDGPEDRLTDIAIKEGYSDKSRVNSESAQKALWPHLKNGVGLDALSALFTDVLTERQKRGRIDAPSAFKPPPRVTLTDTKREAWLKDLANPSVPLKRLSRTIPHGLRGRALLDQCLSKKVPEERAVWLAQCVGANDLRAFRRKGISGGAIIDNEARWSLEWTNIVESFIHDCINSMPETDQRDKVTYAVRVSGLLFVRHLLAKDHYLTWLLENLRSCSQQLLILWLAFVSQYTKAIVQDCSRARHFARALFRRTSDLDPTANDVLFANVKQRLMRQIYALIINYPICALMPDQPQLCDEVLNELTLNIRNDDARSRIRSTLNRNQRLASKIGDRGIIAPNINTDIDAFMNSLSLPCDISKAASTCDRLNTRLQEGVLKLLKWAADPYNASAHRKYLTISILLSWIDTGLDMTECILDSLPRLDKDLQLDYRVVSHIIAELARKTLFNAGKALRCFIVNGSISGATAEHKVSCTRAVLLDLPETVLAPSVVNIRRMLIRSAGLSTTKETEALKRIKSWYEAKFEAMVRPFSKGKTSHDSPIEREYKDLSCSATFVLTSWLCRQCNTTLAIDEAPDDLQTNILSRKAVFVLESIDALGDYCTLADFCHNAIKIRHVDVLACVADMLCKNRASIMSMTAGVPLPRKVLDQYCLWRATSPPSRLVVDPLLMVFQAMHTKGRIIEYLEHEVVLWNQNLAMTASSPLSDFQVEPPRSSSSLLEELESIIASNPVMDETCAQRLLSSLSTYWPYMHELPRKEEISISILLSHLKKACPEQFMREWLRNMLLTQSLLDGGQTVATLIKIGAITMEIFVVSATNAHRTIQAEDPVRADVIATMSLRAMISIIERQGNEVANHASQRASQWTAEYIYFVQKCLVIPAVRIFDRSFIFAFSRMLAQDPLIVEKLLDMQSLLNSANATSNLHCLVMKLLDPLDSLDLNSKASSEIVRHIFGAVDTSRMPVYRFALTCLLSIEGQVMDNKTVLHAAVMSAIEAMMKTDRKAWITLLPVLDRELLSEIGRIAADTLLSSDNTPSNSVQLEILQVAASHTSTAVTMDLCRRAVDRLSTIAETLKEGAQEPASSLASNIEALLEICLIHKRTLFQRPEAQSMKEDLLLVLCRLIAGDHRDIPAATTEFALDVSTVFVEDISHSTMLQLRDSLGPSSSAHPTIKFLLGLQDREDGWLYVASEQSASNKQNMQPFVTKPWEMLADATPVPGINDTALSLSLFDARRM